MKTIKRSQSIILCGMLCTVVMFFSNPFLGADNQDSQKAVTQNTSPAENPFFKTFDTPFGLPPFEKIKDEHFLPAFKKGMKDEVKEIEAIINNPETPSFENTLEAIEKTGELLSNVSRVFFHFYGVDNNDERKKIAGQVIPLLSQHRSFITLNEKLFQRVKAVFNQRDNLKLNKEQAKLLEETHRVFIRSGANLNPEDKEKVKKIDEELSVLGLKFRNNLLSETNGFKMFLEKELDLEGLPQSVIDAAAEAAEKAGQKGKWLFTLHKPSWIPFLQYSKKRELREKLYKGYINRGDNDNEFDNKKIIARIAALRVKKANIMGYKTHADFRLEVNMAKSAENVYKLLDQ
ncbi:MAG: peptidase M3, partial [Candidatus Aminicenantes bacterium]|nr:peptidase M3 [Candidatus Aminicenantes bacterium]